MILESSKNASESLTHCLRVVSHQNEAKQKVIRQEQDKVRMLEETLQALARQHHDLERSIVVVANQAQTSHQTQTQQQSQAQNFGKYRLEDNGNSLISSHRQLSFSSRACLSDSATDLDEYYDAFDDQDDFFDGIENAPSSQKNIIVEDGQNNNNNQATYDVTSFHTCGAGDSTTINDSIPTLENDATDAQIKPDEDEDDRTLASDIDLAFFR